MASSQARRGGRKTKRGVPRIQNSLRLSGYLLFYGVLASGLAYGVRWGYLTIRSHPSFAVAHVQIGGTSDKTVAELQNELQDLYGKNLFSLSLAKIQKRVEDHVWVDEATVALQLPNLVRIVVQERKPAGILRFKNEVLLVSQHGQVICPYNEYGGVLDLPVLVGLNGPEAREPDIRAGIDTLQEIRHISPFFWENIETLDLANEENMIVQLRNVDAPVHLGDQVIAENILNYLTIADYIARHYPSLQYIELGFPDQVAIMPETP